MIVRVTVNDNDFYFAIMGFMKNMWNFFEDRTISVEEQIKAHRKHNEIMGMVNPNNDKTFSKDEKEYLLSYLKNHFSQYINRSNEDEETKQYLIKHLEIKMQKTFTDKWENGEAFYWLQHSNKIVNQ